MKLRIDQKIVDAFPSVNIGVIIAKGINNKGNQDEIQKQVQIIENAIREKYESETLAQHPKIKVWRDAYAAFGAKPKEHKSSVENVYKRVLQGANIWHINTLVDLYNLISLKHMVPVGGEDIQKIQGDIVLTFAGSNEPLVMLLGDKDPRSPHRGEVIYKDDISAICRRWNWREAERTKLTEETKHCILVIEGLFPVTKQEIECTTRELKELIETYCGGKVTYQVLHKGKLELELG